MPVMLMSTTISRVRIVFIVYIFKMIKSYIQTDDGVESLFINCKMFLNAG